MTCAVDDCDKPARKDNLSWGHYKRRQMGKPVNVPLEASRRTRDPTQALLEASLAHADADTEDDGAFDRAVANLKTAANAYGRRGIFERIRAVLAYKKSIGEPVGRPPTPLDLSRVESGEESVTEAATRLGVSRWTIRRRLYRGAKG